MRYYKSVPTGTFSCSEVKPYAMQTMCTPTKNLSSMHAERERERERERETCATPLRFVAATSLCDCRSAACYVLGVVYGYSSRERIQFDSVPSVTYVTSHLCYIDQPASIFTYWLFRVWRLSRLFAATIRLYIHFIVFSYLLSLV